MVDWIIVSKYVQALIPGTYECYLVQQREFADVIKNLCWGDYPASLELNIITMVLIRDARDIRVRREDDVMMGEMERLEDPVLLALKIKRT